MRLICIGDSLTFGYGVHLSQRWTRLCAQETGWELVNEGINGDTTGGMLARMQGGGACGAARGRPWRRPALCAADRREQRCVLDSGSDAAARGSVGAMSRTSSFPWACCRWLVSRLGGCPHAPRAWAAAVDFEAAERTMKEYCAWLQAVLRVGVPYIDFCADFLSPNRSKSRGAAARRSAPDARGTPLDGAAAERAG